MLLRLLVDVREDIEFEHIDEEFERMIDVFLQRLVLKDVFDFSLSKQNQYQLGKKNNSSSKRTSV